MHRYIVALLFALATSVSGAVNMDRTMAQSSRVHIAFTQNNNISLINLTGSGQRAVTTRGTYPDAYPTYSWSPDGNYLLALKRQPNFSIGTLFLFDRNGGLIRSLGAVPFPADFFPSWALDSDQIIYVASYRSAPRQQGFYNTVKSMDVHGRSSYLWGYYSQEGCGGGTGIPAEALYWQETGFGGVPPSVQWSTTQHLAVYSRSCAGGLNAVDTRTGKSYPLGPKCCTGVWNEPSLSSTGTLAAVIRSEPAPSQVNRPSSQVILANPRTGGIIRTVAVGELPVWSRDGHGLFFEQRNPIRTLRMIDLMGNDVSTLAYNTSVWHSNATGQHPVRLIREDAYGFGPLQVTRDNRQIIFSRVDNEWSLWSHLQRNNRYPSNSGLYQPTVRIERYELGTGHWTLAVHAGQPALQP